MPLLEEDAEVIVVGDESSILPREETSILPETKPEAARVKAVLEP